MSEAQFYREQAAEALARAADSALPNVKKRYVLAAETWLRFADRADSVSLWRYENEGLH